MKNAILFTLLLFVISACTAQESQKLSPQDFSEKISNESNGFIILDVRTDEEVAQGMIASAIQMDFYADDFEDQLAKLDKAKTYYVYCRSGGRSGKTVSNLIEAGVSKVYDLEGGMTAWQSAGLPVE